MLIRRQFLTGAVAVIAGGAPARTRGALVTASIDVWPRSPPDGGGPRGPVKIGELGAISNIANPGIAVFAPEKPTGAAMLIAGGGGYRRIEVETEAVPAARWLNSLGIAAFVLTYRLPSEGWNAGPVVALQDAQRAIRLIRANAEAFKIDPTRVGVLGFSAGGHLMGLASSRSDFRSYEAVDGTDEQRARPDACALIYPVVTLEPPYDDTATRRALIGATPALEQSRDWSVQTYVRPGCPPMFLAQAQDDPISNPANTVILAEACERAGAAVELHKISSGGHGFGMGKPGSPTGAWPGWCGTWLRSQHFLN